MILKITLIATFFISIVACSPGAPVRKSPFVRYKAKKDLRCKPDKIKVTRLKKNKYKAKGCDAYAIYKLKCNSVKCILNPVVPPTPLNETPGQKTPIVIRQAPSEDKPAPTVTLKSDKDKSDDKEKKSDDKETENKQKSVVKPQTPKKSTTTTIKKEINLEEEEDPLEDGYNPSDD
ncbi:MAG: hypothetical protein ACQES9_12540 [Myxococcota bacterium]